MMTTLLRWVMAAVFLYAAFKKILDPAGFLNEIENYRLMSRFPSTALAFYLPWLEGVTAVALLLCPHYRSGALVVFFGLLLVFLFALISASYRGLDIRCGCFGETGAGATLVKALLRDLTLLLMVGYLLFQSWKSGRINAPLPEAG